MEEAQVISDPGDLISVPRLSSFVAILSQPCLPNFQDEILQVEICLTSNVMTGGTPSLELHHFGLYLTTQNPKSLTKKNSKHLNAPSF